MMTDDLDPQNPAHWPAIIDGSIFTHNHIAAMVPINVRTVQKWTDGSGEVLPLVKNYFKMVKAMATAMKESNRTPPYHPSYGYATADQIKRIQSLGMGPERDKLLEQIKAQNKAKGKKA